MRLLLDTPILLWSHAEPERLGQLAQVLLDEDNALYVSAASAWEITLKVGTGKLRLPDPPAAWWPSRTVAIGATPLPVEPGDALGVSALPPLHRDPFDRLLIAQARRRGLTLVTADRLVLAYGGDMLSPRTGS